MQGLPAHLEELAGGAADIGGGAAGERRLGGWGGGQLFADDKDGLASDQQCSLQQGGRWGCQV